MMNGLKATPLPDTTQKYCLDLVAMAAHTYVVRNWSTKKTASQISGSDN
jgi:hypothetical protein